MPSVDQSVIGIPWKRSYLVFRYLKSRYRLGAAYTLGRRDDS